MTNSAKFIAVFAMGLAIASAAHASGKIPSANGFGTQVSGILVQAPQQQPDNDAATQREQQQHDNTPGCRYRGGESLELIV